MDLIEFPKSVWLDPTPGVIQAIQPTTADTGWTRVLLSGGKELRIDMVPSQVAQKINEARTAARINHEKEIRDLSINLAGV